MLKPSEVNKHMVYPPIMRGYYWMWRAICPTHPDLQDNEKEVVLTSLTQGEGDNEVKMLVPGSAAQIKKLDFSETKSSTSV